MKVLVVRIDWIVEVLVVRTLHWIAVLVDQFALLAGEHVRLIVVRVHIRLISASRITQAVCLKLSLVGIFVEVLVLLVWLRFGVGHDQFLQLIKQLLEVIHVQIIIDTVIVEQLLLVRRFEFFVALRIERWWSICWLLKDELLIRVRFLGDMLISLLLDERRKRV